MSIAGVALKALFPNTYGAATKNKPPASAPVTSDTASVVQESKSPLVNSIVRLDASTNKTNELLSGLLENRTQQNSILEALASVGVGARPGGQSSSIVSDLVKSGLNIAAGAAAAAALAKMLSPGVPKEGAATRSNSTSNSPIPPTNVPDDSSTSDSGDSQNATTAKMIGDVSYVSDEISFEAEDEMKISSELLEFRIGKTNTGSAPSPTNASSAPSASGGHDTATPVDTPKQSVPEPEKTTAGTSGDTKKIPTTPIAPPAPAEGKSPGDTAKKVEEMQTPVQEQPKAPEKVDTASIPETSGSTGDTKKLPADKEESTTSKVVRYATGAVAGAGAALGGLASATAGSLVVGDILGQSEIDKKLDQRLAPGRKFLEDKVARGEKITMDDLTNSVAPNGPQSEAPAQAPLAKKPVDTVEPPALETIETDMENDKKKETELDRNSLNPDTAQKVYPDYGSTAAKFSTNPSVPVNVPNTVVPQPPEPAANTVPSNWFQQQGSSISSATGAPAVNKSYTAHAPSIRTRKDSRDKKYMRADPFDSGKMLDMLGGSYS